MKKIKIAFTTGSNRYQNVLKAIQILSEDIKISIKKLDVSSDYILIKPNCIAIDNPLAVTHIDAIRAILDFLAQEIGWRGKIMIAEGSGLGETTEAFNNLGYDKLLNEYSNLELKDINYDEFEEIEIFDRNLKPLKVRLSRTVTKAPFRISVGPPKTHDSVIVTLSIKNMAVGAILKGDKAKVHQGPKAINLSLAKINEHTFPHLSIIDGFRGMEGNGPTHGTAVDWHIAIASLDCLAADMLTCYLMGIKPLQVGYFHHLSHNLFNLENFEILGENVRKHQKKFKLHSGWKKQMVWR